MTGEELLEFEQLTKPLVEYIRNKHTPHTRIIIDWSDATITEDLAGWNFDKSLSDMIG